MKASVFLTSHKILSKWIEAKNRGELVDFVIGFVTRIVGPKKGTTVGIIEKLAEFIVPTRNEV